MVITPDVNEAVAKAGGINNVSGCAVPVKRLIEGMPPSGSYS